jgi:uncharacterized damage-inducible protein DinB
MSQPTALTPEFALGLRGFMLAGFKRESAVTRKVIAAVPDEKSSFQPDPNARTAQDLAWHIAASEAHFLESIANLKFDMGGRPKEKPTKISEVLAFYDEHVPAGIARVEALTGEQLVTLMPFAIFNMPAVSYLAFLNNHSIHHRAQLATYLRPMGSKVPAIYGGSYDEPFKMPEPAETAA